MSLDQRPNAILELRNHLAASVVGRRIRTEEDEQIQIKFYRVTAYLDVSLFEDIEQSDLNKFIKFRQFVHRKDATVHSWDQTKMQCLFG